MRWIDVLYTCLMEGSKVKNKETGDLGEKMACLFLERKGYTILETKVRAMWCEIDIIACLDSIIHFVEVKSVSRASDAEWYRPEELVHARKLDKIARFADFYINQKNDDRDYQIDVIGVFLNKRTHTAQCRITENVTL